MTLAVEKQYRGRVPDVRGTQTRRLRVQVVELHDYSVVLRNIEGRTAEFSLSHINTPRCALLESVWTDDDITLEILCWKLKQVGW